MRTLYKKREWGTHLIVHVGHGLDGLIVVLCRLHGSAIVIVHIDDNLACDAMIGDGVAWGFVFGTWLCAGRPAWSSLSHFESTLRWVMESSSLVCTSNHHGWCTLC